MEKFTDKKLHKLPTAPEGVGRRALEGFRTGGLSLMVQETVSPTEDEVKSIEARGFNPDAVQTHLDALQLRGPDGVKESAMLRGAFNDLITQIETLNNGGEI